MCSVLTCASVNRRNSDRLKMCDSTCVTVSSCVSAHMCVNACARALQGGPWLHAEMTHGPRAELRAHRQPQARPRGRAGPLPRRGRRPRPGRAGLVSRAALVRRAAGRGSTAAAPRALQEGAARRATAPIRHQLSRSAAEAAPGADNGLADRGAGRAGPRPQSRASADTYSLEPTLGRPLYSLRRQAAAAISLALCLAAPTFSIPLPLSALRLIFHGGRTGVTSSRKHFLACPSLVLTALSPPPPTWIPVLRPALFSRPTL